MKNSNISYKVILDFVFIKHCDALNFKFFMKSFSSNILDLLINTLDLAILADILLEGHKKYTVAIISSDTGIVR